MKTSELIATVGDENILIQNLLNDSDEIVKTKRGTKISFYTGAVQAEEFFQGALTKYIGIVVWMPRDRVDAAIAADNAKG